MFIANIISESSKKTSLLFNNVNTLKNCEKNIPTLIIGWEYTKQLLTSNYKLSILQKKIDKNIYWTFSKSEKRIDYEKDLTNFIKLAIKNTENNIVYNYFNILTSNYTNIKKIINLLNSDKQLYIYIRNNSFIYISDDSHNVYGIDFNTIDYLGIDRKKIYRKLYASNNELFFSDKFLDKEIRENINNSKIIPILYRMNGKQD